MSLLDPPAEPRGLSAATRTSLGAVTIASLPSPFFMAHRCGRFIAPEETFEAADIALALSANALDWDSNLLLDGGVAMMHDDTVDRTAATATGTVASFSTQQWSNLLLDGSKANGVGSGWPATLKAPLAGAVLDRYGRTVVLSIEAKTTSVLAPLIALIKSRGMQASALINTAIVADIATIKAAGLTAVYYFPAATGVGSPADSGTLSAALAAAPNFIVVQTGTASGPLASVIASGIPVIAGETDRQSDWATFHTAGCVGIVGNEPAYTFNRHNKRTSDSWATKLRGHGFLSNLSSVAPFSGTNAIRFATSGVMTQLIGEVSPTSSAVKTVDIFVTMPTLPTTLTNYLQIRLTDTDKQQVLTNFPDNGYAVNFRADGTMYVYRSDAGVGATLLTSKSGAPVSAPTAGERRHLRMSVSSTNITATDVTTGATITIADAAYRPGGWYLTLSKSDTTGGIWDLDTLSIS